MTRNKLIYIQLLGVFIACTSNLIAQEKLEKTMQVVKPYEPTISDAFKITHLPKITDTVKVIPEIKYTLLTKPMSIGFSVNPIKPAKMVGEPLAKLYSSYVRVGMGTKVIPMIELYINNKRSKDFSIGTYYKFHNSLAQVKLAKDEKEFAGYNDHDFSLFGKKFMKNAVMLGDIGFQSSTRHFYGYDVDRDTIFQKEDIRQNYFTFDLGANYKSNYIDSTHINYDFGFGLRYTEDAFDHNELNFRIGGDINKIFTKEMVGVSLDLENYSKNEKLDSTNNFIIRINPWFGKFGKKWRVKAGIDIYSDIRGDRSNSLYYPEANLEYDIANSYLIPYIGVDGKLEINNFHKISQVNPFIVPGVGVINTDHKIILYGGVRGNFNSTTYYNFKLTYSLIDDIPLFINDLANTDSAGNQFNVVYDDISLVHYFGEFSVSPSEKLAINVKANYRNYKMTNERKAWHKPSFSLSFTTNYNLRQKIILKADILAIGKRYVKLDDVGNFNELESAVDVNLGAEYRYSRVLSGFVQLNNLLSDGYCEWNNYPSYGFNILVGATYSF